MPINVYAFPPVTIVARTPWVKVQPVSVVRSGLTGKEQVQSSQRARWKTSVDVQALSAESLIGGGYMHSLARLLANGIGAVRLTSWSPNWYLDRPVEYQWLSQPLSAVATTSGGMSAWQVSGLPPRYPLTRPGDTFKVGGQAWQSVNAAVANDAGVAEIRVIGATSGGGALLLDAVESAAFKVDATPEPKQGLGANWIYSWSFREVFADEVGGFTEVNPWS
jgi:hypothetical protein